MATPEAAENFSLENLNIIGPGHYAKNGYPHREWAWLRQHQPVAWIQHPKTDPFWAITKHADLVQISKQPRLFLNGPRLLVFVNESGMEQSPTPPFRPSTPPGLLPAEAPRRRCRGFDLTGSS